MTVAPPSAGAAGVRAARSAVVHSSAAAVLAASLSWAHGLALGFVYDAAQYWNAPTALLSGGDVVNSGALSMRGVLTVFVYLPPAILTSILGPGSAAWTVLAWNSLLAAAVCVLLLPRLAASVVPGNSMARLWVSAGVGGILLSGFSQYPLLDTWAVGAALLGLCLLLRGDRWWTAVAGGVAFAVAINLRPSYVLPLLIAAGLLLLARPRRIGLAVPGAIATLVPQVVFNLTNFNSIGVVPYATSYLATVQAAQATYAVRYDTILFASRNPQQWYCDPTFADRLVGESPPADQLGVVTSLIGHLPDSLWFLFEKAAANLQWTFATPYGLDPGSPLSLMTLLVIAVTSTGFVSLVIHTVVARRDRLRLASGVSLLAFWLGSLATLVLSTPESRFALPLVLVGLIGVLCSIPRQLRSVRIGRALLIGIAASIALAVALLLAGRIALSHPAPAGPLKSVVACARL